MDPYLNWLCYNSVMYTWIGILSWVVVFVLGTCAGSFAACVVDRLHSKRDWVKGRSECDHCKHSLKSLDLIPILSWLCLRGKCRYCKKPIGYLSLALEVTLGLLFVVSVFGLAPLLETTALHLITFRELGKTVVLFIWFVALTLLAILAVYDTKYHILPNKIVYPLIVVSVLYVLFFNLLTGLTLYVAWWQNAILALLPMAGLYGFLWLISGGKLIGLGDVKLCVALGLLVGSWQYALITLFIANVLCSLAAVPHLINHKLKISSRVPFGQCLITATILIVLTMYLTMEPIARVFSLMTMVY